MTARCAAVVVCVIGQHRRRLHMRLSPLICSILLVACCSAWAADQRQRFVEFQSLGGSEIFDLSTVQMIQPGRFTITSTAIDDADVMRLELNGHFAHLLQAF